MYCSITGFGQTGPYASRPGYGYIVQGMSGLMSITGPADGEPHKVGVAVTDLFAWPVRQQRHLRRPAGASATAKARRLIWRCLTVRWPCWPISI
ncbi:MAG: CoA transferase [Rivihabitans pingtungensis]